MNPNIGFAPDVSRVEPGFADPVFDSHAGFRSALQAMSRPGTVCPMPAPEAHPREISPAAAALLLSLCDPDTRLWLPPAFEAATPYLRFHTGCPIVANRNEADFALIDGIGQIGDLDDYRGGTDDYPDRSTTLVVQVKRLDGIGGQPDNTALRLSGPGIRDTARIALTGADPQFIDRWQARARLFPRGNDLFFVCGNSLAAIARSTRMEADSPCT